MNARLYDVESELARHLAAEERAEDAREALESRFADLPAEDRAELLWDFIESQRRIAGVLRTSVPIFGGTEAVATIETRLEDDFWTWVEGRV